DIARFLRVLNASFNLALAAQRLEAAHSLNVAFWGYREDIQKGLIDLADEEVEDAIGVLESASTQDNPVLHPAEQASLEAARALLSEAYAATDPGVRRDKTAAALGMVQTAKAAFGDGMDFSLGSGNLMF